MLELSASFSSLLAPGNLPNTISLMYMSILMPVPYFDYCSLMIGLKLGNVSPTSFFFFKIF